MAALGTGAELYPGFTVRHMVRYVPRATVNQDGDA